MRREDSRHTSGLTTLTRRVSSAGDGEELTSGPAEHREPIRGLARCSTARARDMRIQLLLAWTSTLSLAAGQAGEPGNGLARARADFAAADRDKDGRVTFTELRERRIVVSEAEFQTEDVDRSGTWSRDEFTVQFRSALVRTGRSPAADLEAEVARVLGLRRARTVDAARAGQGPAAGRLVVGAHGATPDLLELDAKAERALADLEDRAAGRGAVRADFERVRSAWNERTSRARELDASGVVGTDPSPRFLGALDVLEARARAGSVPRAEFASLRAAWAERPRRARDPAPPSAARDASSIEARFELALTTLEAKALVGPTEAADWTRVGELVVDRVRRSVQGAEPALPAVDDPRVVRATAELRDVLARLERRGREDALTRADFDGVRALYPSVEKRVVPPGPSERDRPR